MKKLLLISLAMLLVGCPPPRYVDIYNNSGAVLYVYGPLGATEIEPRKSRSIRYHHFIHHSWTESPDTINFVWMKVGSELRQYQFSSSILRTMGPPVDFTHFLQVEASGDIRYLGEGVGPPAPGDLPQPPGFPIRGDIQEWVK